MDIRKGLARNLHSVFDDDPEPVAVLTVAHHDAFTWKLSGVTLTLLGTDQAVSVDLEGKTIAGLVEELRADGFICEILSPEFSRRLAIGLMDGDGGSDAPVLYAQNSLLWAMLTPGDMQSRRAAEAVDSAVDQLVFTNADGGWMDFWGRYFGVPRRDGQSDEAYAAFLRREVLRSRSNGYAIQQTVKDWTGHDVLIREPWKEIKIHDKSRHDSGDARFQDGVFYTFGTIEPRGSLREEEWPAVESVVQRNRALGCYLLPHAFAVNGRVVSLHFLVSSATVFAHGQHVVVDRGCCLFSGVSSAKLQEIKRSVAIGRPPNTWTGPWDNRIWVAGHYEITVGSHRTDIAA